MHAHRLRTDVKRLGYLVIRYDVFFVLLELSPHVEDSSAIQLCIVTCELCRIKHCYISLLCSHIISTLGTMQNLLYHRAGANQFLTLKKVHAPLKIGVIKSQAPL